MSRDFLGYEINERALDELVREAVDSVASRRMQLVMACANPHSLVVAEADNSFADALRDSEHLITDGVGVKIIGDLLRIDVGPRITGGDYYQAVMTALNEAGPALGRKGRVFFFGSSESVLDQIGRQLSRDYANLEIAGRISPPFGSWSEEENDEMLAAITRAGADVLWVGMTAPKQEKWVAANRHRLDVPVIGSIGAVFDFYAGNKPRAPDWVRSAGLEWVYGSAVEPKRLGSRNALAIPRFLFQVLRYQLR